MAMTFLSVPDTPQEKKEQPHPFWWPNTTGWITIGFFLLTVFCLWAIIFRPEAIKDNQLFTQLATGIVLTAFIGVILTFYMGSSKQSQENQQQTNQITQTLAQRPQAQAPSPAPASVVVDPPADIHVERPGPDEGEPNAT